MRRRRLGATGPEISVIGFGAWEAGGKDWGPNTSEESVIEAIVAGLDAGIDWIDTAEVYGSGVSERIVGRAVRDRRGDVFIATKVAPAPEGSGFRPDQVRRACDGSLGRLKIDRIDLYQLHWPDDTGVPVEETWGAVGELVDEGKVRFAGVSNFDRPMIERCLAVRHVDSLQPEFNMVEPEQRDLIRWCGEQGVGVVTYAPLASGLLTGAITRETAFGPGDWRGDLEGEDTVLFQPDRLRTVLDTVDALRPIAERMGVGLAQLALAWNWHQPGVTAAIAGSRNPDHVRANAEAGDLELDDAALAEIEVVLAGAA
jgi:aryl-alcohol dehydrogenase-like predicted oxidoreductase